MLRKLGITLVSLLGLTVVLAAVAFGYAQTGIGRAQIASLIAGQLGEPGRPAEVEGLSGLLPFDVRLDALRLRDPAGVWLEVEQARLRIDPTALLRGRLAVEELGARRVALHRLPESEPKPPEPFSLPQLPELPTGLPRVTVDRLSIAALEVGAPVLGEAATFTIDGNAAIGAEDLAVARLALRRTDQPTAELDLAADLDLRARALRVDVRGSETGGLLAAATNRPEAGALRLSLAGDGPLSDWNGKLAIDAERLARLDLAIDLAYAERKSIGLAGTLAAAPGVLPPELADLVGREADLTLRAGETGPQRFALETVSVRTASASLSGSGAADLAADTVTGALMLSAPDLAPFSALAGTPLAGGADLSLAASGAARQPTLDLAIRGEALRAASLGISRLDGDLTVTLSEPLAAGPIPLRAEGKAEGEGLTLDGRPLADGKVELTLAGDLPARGDVELRELALRSSLGEVTASASLDRERLAGSARVDARVPELKAVMLALGGGPPLAGSVALGADIVVGEGAGSIDLALDGGITGLAGLPPGAQELIGSEPVVRAEARVEPGRVAVVEDLALTGAGVRVEGDAHYGLADRALAGELRLAVPEIAMLEAAVGQPIAGSAQLRALLRGTADRPEIVLDGAVERLMLAGQRFDRLTLDADAGDLVAAPAGSARIAVTRGKQEVALATAYRVAGDLLELTGLTLNAPATRLAGNAEVALGTPAVRGSLAGEARDLAALQAWTGQKLTGRAKVDLRLATPQNRQDATLDLELAGFGGEFGSLRSAKLTAALTDALGRGGLDAKLDAQGFTSADLAIDRATVAAGGRLAEIGVTATAAGSQAGQPFDLTTTVALDVLGGRKAIRVSEARGEIAGEALSLRQPATITLDGAAVALDRLDLSLGPARLQGSLDLGAQRVAGELALAELPLASLGRFGAPALAGTGRAVLTLTGTRRAPEIALDASVAKAALDPAAKVTLDGTLTGALRGGRLDADLALSGLGAEPLAARASLPATFTLEPVAFALADTAGMSGRIGGPLELARLTQLAALGGTQLAGTLTTALDLSGTLRQPALTGSLTLDGGSVQDVASGLVLRNLALRARAAGDRLTIEQLAAEDPAGGKLGGKGALRLLAGGGIGYDVTLDATRARLLDNALGVVILSGTLGATGDLEGAFARGRLTVDRADFQIPDATGPSVPVIAVTEVNRSGERTEVGAGPAIPFALGFDIGLDIPGRLFVRGRGLDSEWEGELALRGDLADPLIEGDLDVRRGHFDLLDRRFTIDRGSLDFVGSRPPVPMIDLAATARTVEVAVTLVLRGPALDPEITLTSEPALPQDEILSRLLFGTSVARITPMQGLRLAAAVQELQGGGMISGALSRFRRAVGVDTLDVQSTETTNQDGETEQQTSARVGKYVTDKVYLEVEQGVTDGGSKARVQVDLTPNLSVGSTVNDQQQTGVGLQWRYDY